MKIKEIIKETHEDTIENLRNECSQTIELMNKTNRTIYHGSNRRFNDIEKITPKTGRTPKDTPQLLHNLINEYLDEKKIKTDRSNSIFGLKSYDYHYTNSKFFILFPVNNANVLWFENSEDLFISLNRYIRKNYNKYTKNLSENEIDKNHLKQFLDTLKPNTSLKKYFYNNDYSLELMISSPVYVVNYKFFNTTDFKEQIGLK